MALATLVLAAMVILGCCGDAAAGIDAIDAHIEASQLQHEPAERLLSALLLSAAHGDSVDSTGKHNGIARSRTLLAGTPELRLPGVAAALAAARVLEGTPGAPCDDGEQFRAACESLVAAVEQLRPAASSAYPVTRRLVQAALRAARAHGAERRCGAALEDARARIFAHFLGLHRDAQELRGGQVYFQHISRSGGTSICKMAKAQDDLSIAQLAPESNCAMQSYFNESFCWANEPAPQAPPEKQWWRAGGRPQSPWSCETRHAWLAQRRLNFHAAEYVLPPSGEGGEGRPAGVCPQFTSFTMLRHPVAHALSLIAMIRSFVEDYPLDFDTMARLAPQIVDCYNIRVMLSPQLFHAHAGVIKAHHLAQAQAQLLEFDGVLILEEGASNDAFLQVGLGWNASLARTHANKVGLWSVLLEQKQHSPAPGDPEVGYDEEGQLQGGEKRYSGYDPSVPLRYSSDARQRLAQEMARLVGAANGTAAESRELLARLFKANVLDHALYAFAQALQRLDAEFFADAGAAEAAPSAGSAGSGRSAGARGAAAAGERGGGVAGRGAGGAGAHRGGGGDTSH